MQIDWRTKDAARRMSHVADVAGHGEVACSTFRRDSTHPFPPSVSKEPARDLREIHRGIGS